MYGEDIDLRDIVRDAAITARQNDRDFLVPTLAFIEKFAAVRGMLLGGNIVLREYQATDPVSAIAPDLWFFELFSGNIEQDMHVCARELHDHLARDATPDLYRDYRTIYVQTIVPGARYRLMVNYRLVAVGNSYNTHNKALKPLIITGPFGTSQTQILPNQVHIMRLARELCNPSLAGVWSACMERLEWIMKRYVAQMPAKYGGDVPSAHPDEHTQSQSSADEWTTSGILIGECAMAHYMGEWPPNKGARPQYLGTFEDLDAMYIDPHVPDDLRLRKMTIKTHDGSFIADLFNTCAYELVPVSDELPKAKYSLLPLKKRGALVASPMCVLRFIFIEVWALSLLIAKMQSSGQETMPIRRRCAYLEMQAARFYAWMCAKCDIARLFPLRYEGVYVPEVVSKKKAASAASPYYLPANREKISELLAEIRSFAK